MSRNYKINDQEKAYYVTFTVIKWMDVFIRNEYRQVILESLIRFFVDSTFVLFFATHIAFDLVCNSCVNQTKSLKIVVFKHQFHIRCNTK